MSVDINFDDYIESNITGSKIELENTEENNEKSVEKIAEKKRKEKTEIKFTDNEIKDILTTILKKEESIELLINKLNKKYENSLLTKINDEMDNLLSKIKETEIYLITLKKETAENVKLLEEQIINNTVSRMEIMYKSLNNIIKSLEALNNELNFDKKINEKKDKGKYGSFLIFIFISIFIIIIGFIIKLN